MPANGLLFDVDSTEGRSSSKPRKRSARKEIQAKGGGQVGQGRRKSVQAEFPMGKYDELRREELIRLLEQRDADERSGIRLSYSGQAPPWQIVRKVQPRQQRIDRKLSFGSEDHQAANLILEGENLQAMVSLYKYRGQIDLI